MPLIAVLEDDPRRITAMRSAAAGVLADCEIQFFASAREMQQWLTLNLDRLQLLSLDCDLDFTAPIDGDCGSGEDITRLLASRLPKCPILIHSSNALRAPAMHMELVLAGCDRVVLCPFRDAEQWAVDVREALNRSAGT